MRQILYGYSRDDKGAVVNYHPKSVANTIHTFTGGGGQQTSLLRLFMRLVDAKAITRARTEVEKLRRHIHGDKGAKFSNGKYMVVTGNISGCVTTLATKDNLCAEIYET